MGLEGWHDDTIMSFFGSLFYISAQLLFFLKANPNQLLTASARETTKGASCTLQATTT